MSGQTRPRILNLERIGDVFLDRLAALAPCDLHDILGYLSSARGLDQRPGSACALRARHRMYVDIVLNGLPFPQVPHCHPAEALNASLRHFTIELLDVVDVVVSKLSRFNANDQSDIGAMVQRDLVPHGRLIERFTAAVDFFSADARAEDLPNFVSHLHRIERDLFGEPETPIECPPGSRVRDIAT